MATDHLKAIALNCTLKSSPGASSTGKLLGEVLEALAEHDVTGEIVRIADFDVRPGVTSNEGPGDEWPGLRTLVLDADILVMGTPIWMGQPSSVCKRVLERMDAFISETDERGRRISVDRVAGVAVVGNEDGAHHVCAELFQALNDVGFTVPAMASTYWTDEVSKLRDYQDLPERPDTVKDSTEQMALHLAHLAGALRGLPYPAS